MQPSILASFIYIIAFLSLAGGIYAFRKTKHEIYGAIWVPLCFIAVMCYQAMVAGLLDIAKIPINLWSIGIMDLIPAIYVWRRIIKGRDRQRYIYEKKDLFMLITLILVMTVFAFRRYGTELLINYNAVDGASHLLAALGVINGQGIDAMYYSSLHNALLIEVFAPFASAGIYYKIYVLGDILHLFLAGLMFWGVIRRYTTDRFMTASGIIVTMLYLLGYPANSTLFGFSYLGMSLTVILYMIAVTDGILKGDISGKAMVVLLSTGCLAVFESYVLFMPVIFFGLLVWIFVRQYINGKLITGHTIVVALSIFLVPTLLGLWFTYRGIFANGSGLTVGTQISIEGGIYRNLFTNFIVLCPFAVAGIASLIKKRENSVTLYFVALEIPFTLGLFFLALKGKVSGYYYYKNYFMLWIFMFILAFYGLAVLEKQARLIVTSGFLVWLVLVFMFVFNIDVRIQNKNELLYGSAQIRPFMDIYAFNYDFFNTPKYDKGKLELYSYIRDNMIDKGLTDEVNMVGCWEDCMWMRSVTNTLVDIYDGEGIASLVEEGAVDYVVVLYDSEEYNMAKGLYDGFDRVYENSSGYIASCISVQ